MINQKKGSSRAVFFPKDDKSMIIDGNPAKMKTAIKIAFPGYLDKYKTGDEEILGNMQNQIESDHYIRNKYGMLNHDYLSNSYSTNEDGVLAPVIHSHPNNHYLEMGHVSKITPKKFKELTKTKTHPKGLSIDDVRNTLLKEHYDANGHPSRNKILDESELHEHNMQHPFIQSLAHLIHEADFHPCDIHPANMGIWTHPHTGKEYPVLSDYGTSTAVTKEYHKRRDRLLNSTIYKR